MAVRNRNSNSNFHVLYIRFSLSPSGINITKLGTFLLVPTRASRALASLSVIQTDLLSVFNNLFIIDFSNNLDIHRVFYYIGLYGGGDAIYGAETRLADTVGALVCLAPASTRCRRARHAAWGGSPVGGHGDVFSGGSTWTVTGPLSCFDFSVSLCFACSH